VPHTAITLAQGQLVTISTQGTWVCILWYCWGETGLPHCSIY